MWHTQINVANLKDCVANMNISVVAFFFNAKSQVIKGLQAFCIFKIRTIR